MPFQQLRLLLWTISSGYPGDPVRIQSAVKTMRDALKTLGHTVLFLSLVATSQAQNQSGSTPQPSTSAPNTTPAAHRENYDPLLDLPPLPRGQVTLIGGTVVNLDEVMNRMVVQPFGGKQKMKVRLDTRTHFYRDGKPIQQREIQQGQRVYLDTMLNGDKVFAKSIWIQTAAEGGIARGQIVEFDIERKILTVRDELADQPVKMQLTAATVVHKGDQPASLNDLTQGALVTLGFGTQRELREVTIVATPGTVFSFAGRVTYLDLSRKLIAIHNDSDGKSYDIFLDAVATNILRQLREGQNVTVSAVFDGTRYSARQIDLPRANSAQQNQ
jgi:cold shock CspA family protein